MKILMVLETKFPPDLRVENEIDALTHSGHEITIVSGDREHLSHTDKFGSAQVIRYYIPTFIYKSSIGELNFPFYFSFWEKHLKKILQSQDFDAVHVHDLPLISVIIKLKHKLQKKYKIILDLHENYPDMLKIAKHTQTFLGKMFFNYQQWLDYERDMVLKVDTVITVVEEMRQRIISLGASEDKVVVVSNTFNAKRFTPPERKATKDNFILFYGGGVTIDRGLQYVIKSLSIIAKRIPDIMLWIVGDGSYLDDLKKFASEYSVDKYVKFFGRKSFPDLLELLSHADVALIPHLKSPQTESGIPHKLFQYVVTGIPIVASNCGPFIRILGDNDAGIIYKYDDVEKFSEAIFDLHEKPILSSSITKNAKEILYSQYLWEYDARRLVDIYN